MGFYETKEKRLSRTLKHCAEIFLLPKFLAPARCEKRLKNVQKNTAPRSKSRCGQSVQTCYRKEKSITSPRRTRVEIQQALALTADKFSTE